MPAQKEDLRREENTTERGLRQVSDEVLQVIPWAGDRQRAAGLWKTDPED